MYIVRSGAADKFDSLVSELGQNPQEIMAAVGLSAAQFRDPDTYLAYPRLAELLEEAAARCKQPLFGALLAERQNLQSLGDLPMLVSRAETVGDALAQVQYQSRVVLRLRDLRIYRCPFRLQFFRTLYMTGATSLPLWVNRALRLVFTLSGGLIGQRIGWIGLYEYAGDRGKV